MKEYKILAQVSPDAGAGVTVYTVPTGLSTVISTVAWCNRSRTTALNLRLAVIPKDTTLENKNFIMYDRIVPPRTDDGKTIGITLSEGDSIYVLSDQAMLSLTLFGGEVSKWLVQR